MRGAAESAVAKNWEQVSEAYAFVFYSCDLKGRIHYVNSAWHDAREHETAPLFLSRCEPNRNLFDAFTAAEADRFLNPIESLRHGHIPHVEEIVPCHTLNQLRWTLLRLQRFGEELVLNYYFLRHYSVKPPTNPKISCLLDSGSWANNWVYDPTPLDDDTAIALCPNCALHFYTNLRQG